MTTNSQRLRRCLAKFSIKDEACTNMKYKTLSFCLRARAAHSSSPSTPKYFLDMKLSYLISLTVLTSPAISQNVTNVLIYGSAGSEEDKAASSPALYSLNDTALSNWGCSVHEAFSSYPTTGKTDFQALAIAQDVLGEGSQSFGDGSVGLPYIISHGATPAACGDGHWDEAYGEECDDGNTLDGDGCSSSCKCESGLPNGDGTCAEPPRSSGYGPPSPCHTGKHGPKRKPGGYGAVPTTSS